MIVFGHNNFTIKSFSPEEAGLPASEDQHTRIVVKQRYFHIFWIPFFPIGKIWGLKRAGSEDLYEIPAALAPTIKKNLSVGTPWYSFSLVILGMVVASVLFLQHLQKEQNWEDNFYNRLEESKMLIQYPTTGDFYELKRYEDKDSYTSTNLLLKVKSYDNDNIVFNSTKQDLYEDAGMGYSYDEQKTYSTIETNNYNPTTISKATLIALLRTEYKSYKDPKIQIEGLEGYFSLDEIERMELE